MAVLATFTSDGLLGRLAPRALAAAAGTALVIDLDPGSPTGSGGSLARLVADGPRLSDLRPERRGVALLDNGGIGLEAARPVVEALTRSWPNVVLRLPGPAADLKVRIVPIVPLVPGSIHRVEGRCVYQQVGWRLPAPGPGVVLATPARAVVRALLEGRLPASSRWVRSWRRVWAAPWG